MYAEQVIASGPTALDGDDGFGKSAADERDRFFTELVERRGDAAFRTAYRLLSDRERCRGGTPGAAPPRPAPAAAVERPQENHQQWSGTREESAARPVPCLCTGISQLGHPAKPALLVFRVEIGPTP